MTVATYAQVAAGKVAAVVQALWSAQLRLGRQANIAWAFSAKGAAASAVAMRVAILGLMAATGVGLVIAAVSTAVSLFSDNMDDAADSADGLARAQNGLKEAHESGAKAAAEAQIQIERETDKLGDLISSKEDTTTAVQALNEKYGEAFGYHETALEWYNTLISKSEEYCQALYNQAVAEVVAAKRAQNAVALRENYYKQEQLRDQLDEAGGGFFNFKAAGLSKELRGAQKEAAALVDESRELDKIWEDVKFDYKPGPSQTENPAAPTKKGPKGGNGNKNVEVTFEKGSLGYIDQELEKLRKKRLAVTVDADRLKLDEQIADLEREKLELEFRPKMEGWKQVDEELAKRGIGMDAKPAVVEVEFAPKFDPAKVVAEIKGKIPVLKLPAAMSPEEKRGEYDRLSQKASTIQQDYEIGIIGKDEALAAIASINAELERLGLEPIELPDIGTEKFKAATDAIGQMGQSFSSLGSALELPELNIAGTIAQAIATMTQGYANATLQAKELGPIGWLAFAATGLAQLVAMISTVKNVTAFAQGGIVSGPTMALVGEYAGASNNPEVIAPLDKLRSMLHPQGGVGGTVRFEIEGRKLVGVIGNEKKLSRTKL